MSVLNYFEWVNLLAGGLIIITGFFSGYYLFQEREYPVTVKTIPVFFVPGTVMLFLTLWGPEALVYILSAINITLFVLLVWPPGLRFKLSRQMPETRLDERDIMFSRRLLEKGSERYKAYYTRHPDHQAPDDHFRNKPGLLSRNSRYYEPLSFAAADALFGTVETLAKDITGEVSENKNSYDAERITLFLKNFARKMGALDAGVTLMKPVHYYHTGGRNYNYGQPIQPNHKYGLAFTVEMESEMIGAGPKGPTVMESAHQYLESGKIAVALAGTIRNLGYDARAHIDGHYLVVCPMVARDAGLGDIGRMGLLMTPQHGPRVRIGVVTTDLPLIPDPAIPDPVMTDFCYRCRKCADNCPANAIPTGPPEKIGNVTRWKINQEACYTFWTIAGTDCGRCIAVCPYAHKNNLFYRVIRKTLRRSFLINRLALPLDQYFYGSKPKVKDPPDWIGGNVL